MKHNRNIKVAVAILKKKTTNRALDRWTASGITTKHELKQLIGQGLGRRLESSGQLKAVYCIAIRKLHFRVRPYRYYGESESRSIRDVWPMSDIEQFNPSEMELRTSFTTRLVISQLPEN